MDERITKDLAGLIMIITDPTMPKWAKEQTEIQARAKAKSYLRKLKEGK